MMMVWYDSLKYVSSWRDIIRVCCQSDRNARPSFDSILRRLEPIYTYYKSPANNGNGNGTSANGLVTAPRKIESKSAPHSGHGNASTNGGDFKQMGGIDDIYTGSVDHVALSAHALSSSPMIAIAPPSSYASNGGMIASSSTYGVPSNHDGRGGLAAAAAAAAASVTLTIGTPSSSLSSSRPVAVPSPLGLGLGNHGNSGVNNAMRRIDNMLITNGNYGSNGNGTGPNSNVASVSSSPLAESVSSHNDTYTPYTISSSSSFIMSNGHAIGNGNDMTDDISNLTNNSNGAQVAPIAITSAPPPAASERDTLLASTSHRIDSSTNDV
jgi:hypothetical protein